MRAIVLPKYGPPENLQLRQLPKPVPAENELLVKVVATTVTVADVRSRGFDVPKMFWLPARFMLGFFAPRKKVLGMELSGVVEAVGRDVTRFQVGDEVFASTLENGFAGYAEYKVLPEDGQVVLKPAGLTHQQAAAIPVGGRTAVHYLRKANLTSGQKILIYGASGSVGSYSVQLARHLGADVTAVCSGRNIAMVEALGADQAIDYTKQDVAALGDRFDVIFDTVDKLDFTKAIGLLKEGGTYINVAQPLPTWQTLQVGRTGRYRILLGENPPPTPEALAYLGDLAVQGIVNPVIDRCFPLEEVVEAHRYVDTGRKRGNVVVQVS